VKWLLNAEKAGHTGTLDPLATGLLPICLGEATKFAGYLLDGDKEYIATAQLGITTDSGDSEGQILMTTPVATDLEQILTVFERFRGEITQTPPMYSALKHNGRPLYEYARAGIEIERPSRQIVIYALELLNYSPSLQQITFRALVSKGTYIRVLAQDIGEALACGASLVELRRTKTNQFCLEQAYTSAQIETVGNINDLALLPVDILVNSLPRFELTPAQFEVIKYGNILRLNGYPQSVSSENEVRLYANNCFLGVGVIELKDEQILLRPKRIIAGLSSFQPWL
jgi:tRNA pseudouridine55 synthase